MKGAISFCISFQKVLRKILGQLVRSIMYPKPVDFQFTKDLLKMVGVLGLIAFGGFLYAIVIMARRGNGVHKILLRSLDIITIVVFISSWANPIG